MARDWRVFIFLFLGGAGSIGTPAFFDVLREGKERWVVVCFVEVARGVHMECFFVSF